MACWTAAAAFVASIMAFALLPAVETGWDVNLKNQAVAYRGLLRVVGLPAGTGGRPPTSRALRPP